MKEGLQGEAHIRLWRLTPDTPQARLDILSSDERRRADRIRHPRVREHFLTGRLLARHALSQYADVDPHDWHFDLTADGRPEIASPRIEAPLRFNLSHTDGLVACVVTDGADCGIDLESLDRRIDMMGIASHSFGPDEVADLEAVEAGDLSRRFFALWTLKEAYLKAVGSGIRLRLDAVRFRLDPSGTLDHWINGADKPLNEEWRFALYDLDEDHFLAIAVRAGQRHDLAVRCWETTGDSTPGDSPDRTPGTLLDRPVDLAPLAFTALHR